MSKARVVTVHMNSMEAGGITIAVDGEDVERHMNALEALTFIAALTYKRHPCVLSVYMPQVSSGLYFWWNKGHRLRTQEHPTQG